MTRSQSAPLHKTDGRATLAGAGGLPRPPAERLSLLRLSAGDRALGALLVIASLWAGVYWALH